MSSSAPEEQEPESEPQRRRWVALVSAAVLPGNEDDERAQKFAGCTDVLLDFSDPPLLSYLVLHPRVAPDPRCNDGPLSAYILAADRSGCFLLQVVEGNHPRFFLGDTHTCTVSLLPPVSSSIQAMGVNIRPDLSIGLIADPHHRHPGHYVVAQLHPTTSDGHPNRILYYSTAKGCWFIRDFDLQEDSMRKRNPFSETAVLAHDGRLWWIALAYGVFFCDPCTPVFQTPELRFIPLPGDVAFDPRIDQRRCVRLSEGKLRFVEIRGLSYVDAPAAAANPTVWMWTLDDPEGPRPWKLEYEVAFAEIWDNKTYADKGLLPGKVPHVALVDPNDHYVVYFFQDSTLFGLDMREKKVVASKLCSIDRDQDQLMFRSSRPIVDAWELPPPPPTLPGDDDSSPYDSVAEKLGDDVVAEILVRLPSDSPDNLLNAALVCTQWGRVASSPIFRSLFRNLHSGGGPHLLGYFCDIMDEEGGHGKSGDVSRFITVTESPFLPLPQDRRTNRLSWRAIDSRHGRVLLYPMVERWAPFQNIFRVWCPITGEEVQLPPMPRCPVHTWSAALVCSPAADDGVDPSEHLGCHQEAFRVVLVGADKDGMFSIIYSSATQAWTPPICSDIAPRRGWLGCLPAARVQHMLCFPFQGGSRILSYELDTNAFALVEGPPASVLPRGHGTPWPITMDDGRLGLAIVCDPKLQLWARVPGTDGEVWKHARDIDLSALLSHPAGGRTWSTLVGFADCLGAVFLWSPGQLFLLSLRTGQVMLNRQCEGIIQSIVPFVTYCIPALRGGYGIQGTRSSRTGQQGLLSN